MGIDVSAYGFYGVHVPSDLWTERYAEAEGEKVSSVIRAVKEHVPDVCYLTAGAYDRHMLFLCTSARGEDVEAEMGKFITGARHSRAALAEWDRQIQRVADAMGYGSLGQPGWITVASET